MYVFHTIPCHSTLPYLILLYSAHGLKAFFVQPIKWIPGFLGNAIEQTFVTRSFSVKLPLVTRYLVFGEALVRKPWLS